MNPTDDFQISDKRRRLWNCELSLFGTFAEICERHGLRYYASGGTLLGAVRHKGFIPWDDDMDISMPRGDYNMFLSVASRELPDTMFLQTAQSDKDYYFAHAKIRMNHTTAMKKAELGEQYRYHRGVFIDIFPMDNVPDGTLAFRLHKFVALKLLMIFYYTVYYYDGLERSVAERIKHAICSKLFGSEKALCRLYRIYDKWIQRYNKTETNRFGLISCFYHVPGDIWDKALYWETVDVPFEDTIISIPSGYDTSLHITYGDYEKPVKGTSIHGTLFVDTANDYSKYLDGTLTFREEDMRY